MSNAVFDAWKPLYIQTDEYKQGLLNSGSEFPSINEKYSALLATGNSELAAIKNIVRQLETKYGL